MRHRPTRYFKAFAFGACLCTLAAGTIAAAQDRIQHRRTRDYMPSSPGPHQLLAEPQLRAREAGGRIVTVAGDAIVASESFLIAAARSRIEGPIHLGPPFNLDIPAGTFVVMRTGPADQSRCLVIDAAPRDEHGLDYPNICLIDRDGDGRFETAHLFGDDDKHAVGAQDIAITPVALAALPPGEDSRLTWFIAERRLRVARVDRNGATIIVECRIMPGGAPGLGWTSLAPSPDFAAMLPLRAGGTARLSGLDLAAAPNGTGGWQIAVSGDFAHWLLLRYGNTMIDTGAGTMQAD